MPAIRLDPWTHIKEVHWRPAREAIYLVSSAVFSQFRPAVQETPIIAVGLGTPTPPPTYNTAWDTALECTCLNAADFFTDCSLFDETGALFGNATQSEFSITKPSMTQAQAFGQLEVWAFLSANPGDRFAAHSVGSAPPLFPGYVSGPATLISTGALYGGGSGVFDTGVIGDGLGQFCQEIVNINAQIASFNVTPSQATYRGGTYTPIAARYGETEQFTPDLSNRYNANSVAVLFQRT